MAENNYYVYKHTSPSGKIYIGIASTHPKTKKSPQSILRKGVERLWGGKYRIHLNERNSCVNHRCGESKILDQDFS